MAADTFYRKAFQQTDALIILPCGYKLTTLKEVISVCAGVDEGTFPTKYSFIARFGIFTGDFSKYLALNNN